MNRPAFSGIYREDDNIMTNENNLAMYKYIVYAFEQLAKENETIKENLKEIKKNIQKQLNVEVMNVAFDTL